MRSFLFTTLFAFFLAFTSLKLYSQDLKEYIDKHGILSNSSKNNIEFGSTDLVNSDLVFFGFIHGSSTPQIVDFELLEHLVKEGGFRFYAPEVDISQAFFLNKYLETGDIKFLDFTLFFYEKRVPQDASWQLRKKWEKIYRLNQSLPQDDKLTVIGTDIHSRDERIAITHLAYLLENIDTNIPQVDSLKLFTSTEIDDKKIWSGAPAMPMVNKYGGNTYEYVYPVNSKYNFMRRFLRFYDSNKAQIVDELAKHEIDIAEILDIQAKYRENHIFERFKSEVIPLIKAGEKVYSNYGYAHIFQKGVYNSCYLACKIKNEFPNIKMNSVVGLMANSKVLKERKWKQGKETITERGLVFNKMLYNGYKTSSSWDGDNFFEKLEGIDQLKAATHSEDILFLDLTKPNSPFAEKSYLVKYKKGGKGTYIDDNSNTLEYFQYVVFMEKSDYNIPLQAVVN